MKRFKRVSAFILIICASAFMFVGCGDSSSHTVKFMIAKTITYTESKGVQCVYTSAKNDNISVEDGNVIGSVSINTKYGNDGLFRFVGWYTEKDCINYWDLYRDEVKCDLTLYAKYERVPQLYD